MKKFAVLILSSTLCACSANVAPGADVTPTLAPVQSKTFENKIQGPNLSGDWKSDCNPDKWSSNYVSFHIKTKTSFGTFQTSPTATVLNSLMRLMRPAVFAL